MVLLGIPIFLIILNASCNSKYLIALMVKVSLVPPLNCFLSRLSGSLLISSLFIYWNIKLLCSQHSLHIATQQQEIYGCSRAVLSQVCIKEIY